ncbi:glycerophosphodiester phosphodiesterase [Wenjunlia vitaminophila]|nr:glycerophosphodiester phosphodiesterase family protein [Wenjunlia vitaminophila]
MIPSMRSPGAVVASVLVAVVSLTWAAGAASPYASAAEHTRHRSNTSRDVPRVGPAPIAMGDAGGATPRPSVWIRPDGAPLRVVAHRGASLVAPENTLVGDEAARRGGAWWIESDVQPSRDGVPHVLHDSTVDRTTDGRGAIRDLTAAELRGLDAGSWFGAQYAGQHLPTLAAQLEDLSTRGGNLLLEIKGPHTRRQVARIITEIRSHRMTDRVLVQSFDVNALRHTRELAPELALGLLRGTLDADPVAVSKELSLTSYNPSDAALADRPAVVGDLHDAGVAVTVWTVDTATRWRALLAAGVDAVITNRPAELSGWNAARLAARASPWRTATRTGPPVL